MPRDYENPKWEVHGKQANIEKKGYKVYYRPGYTDLIERL
jgi:hypothetical protein